MPLPPPKLLENNGETRWTTGLTISPKPFRAFILLTILEQQKKTSRPSPVAGVGSIWRPSNVPLRQHRDATGRLPSLPYGIVESRECALCCPLVTQPAAPGSVGERFMPGSDAG